MRGGEDVDDGRGMTATTRSCAPSVSRCPADGGQAERWLRAGLFAVISTVLAAAGHHLGSKDPVLWPRLLGAGVMVFLAALPGAGRARRPAPVLAATLAAQLVLHRGLSMSSGASAVPAHRAHGAAGQEYATHHSVSLMLVAHVVAAASVAVLMQRADRRLSELPHAAGRWVEAAAVALAAAAGRLSLRPADRTGRQAVPMPAARRPVPLRARLVHVVVRRGPPGAGCSVAVPLVTRRSAPHPKEPAHMNTSRISRSVSRLGLVSAAALVTVVAGATTAAAHAGVTASDARALAENVTLTFTSEAESDTAGIKELRIVLPEGIAPDAVTLKDAPKGWKLTPTAEGYTVGGTTLQTGTDAEYSVVVRQLPDATSLAFKTVETYGDGKVARWIEVPGDGEQVENPAPLLKLEPAARGAKPITPSPSTSPATDGKPSSDGSAPAKSPASSASQPAKAGKESDSGTTGVIVGVIAAVAVLGAGGALWFKRRNSASA